MASKNTQALQPTTPFLYVALLGAYTGGFPAHSETIYIGRTGEVLVSKETNDGRLFDLRGTTIDTAPFFETLEDITRAPNGKPRKRPNKVELPEYYPQRVAVAYNAASGEYAIASYPRSDIPEHIRKLLAQVVPLRNLSDLEKTKPGLYIRAQRLPKFDPRIQSPDLSIGAGEAARDRNLENALRREMALVRVGNLGERVFIAGRVALRPQRPVHIKIGEMVYRIFSYAFRQREK